MYCDVRYSGASAPHHKSDSMKSAVIHVAGLSGNRPASYEGPGKSSLCYRFVYPSEADFISDHSSVLSRNDFEGEVILGEHSVYWGARILSLQQKKGKAREEQITVEVVEHTEFLQDITNVPFGCTQRYAERALKGRIKGGKQSFKSRELLGFPSDYKSVIAPAKINQLPRGLLLVADCSRGGSCLYEYFQKQLHLLEEILSLKKKDKARVEAAIVATKCDELDDDRVAEVERLAKKHKVPLYQCSAKENVSVVECFASLAARVLKMTVVDSTLQKATHIEKGMGSTLQTISRMRASLKSYLTKRIHHHDMTYADLERSEELIEAKEVLGAVEPFSIFLQYMVTLKVQALMSHDSLTMDAVREYVKGHPDMHNNEEKCIAIATELMETARDSSPSATAVTSPTISSSALQPCYDSGIDDTMSTHTSYSLSAHTLLSVSTVTSDLTVPDDPNEADRSSSDDGEPSRAGSNSPPVVFPITTFKPDSHRQKPPSRFHTEPHPSSQVGQKKPGSPPLSSSQGETAQQTSPGGGCDPHVASPSLSSTFTEAKSPIVTITSGDILGTQRSSPQSKPPIPSLHPGSGAVRPVELPSIPSTTKEEHPLQRGVSSAAPTPSCVEVRENVSNEREACDSPFAMEEVYDAPFALPNDPPPPPPPVVKAHTYDEMKAPTAPPQPIMMAAHDEMKAPTSPPQPVMTAARSSEDMAAKERACTPTVALDKLQQRPGPLLPPPGPTTGRRPKSPEPPPKPARRTTTKPTGSPTPSSDNTAESSKPGSPSLASKKGSKIAQLQKQLQGSSSSPGVPRTHGKEVPKAPLVKAPSVPVGPRQPLLPPQSKLKPPSSDGSNDTPVPVPPRNLPDNAAVDALPPALPQTRLSPGDDDAPPVVPPRNYVDEDDPEMEEPVIPDRGYSREDVYGRSPAVATSSTAEERTDSSPDLPPEIPDRKYSVSDVLGSPSPDTPPEIPDRKYSVSDVLGSPSKDGLDDQRLPMPLPTALDIDSRPPMPLPSKMEAGTLFETPLPKAPTPDKHKAPHPPRDAGISKKYNTLPDRRTQTPEGRPLPALPFANDNQPFRMETSSHPYTDPDSVIPEFVRQTTLPRSFAPAGYLQPKSVQPKTFPPSLKGSPNRSLSQDSSSPPVTHKQVRVKDFNKSHSIDVPPTLPPKLNKRPSSPVPPTKPGKPLPGTLPPSRLRAVTATELPLPAIPGFSSFSSSASSTLAGGHSYDYVENWVWQVRSLQATPPRGSQRPPTSNPLFPTLEELMGNRFVQHLAPVPPRHTAKHRPPALPPVEDEDDDYEKMEDAQSQIQVSVERQVFQQLPSTIAAQLNCSPYCNVPSAAPVRNRRDSGGYVPVEEPHLRSRVNTLDSLGYVPMDCPSEITQFIQQKLMRDRATYCNITKPAPPVMKIAAMDLESVEYYNVQRSRGERQHMLDYLDVHPLPAPNYGNLPPPLPPKQSSAPPLPPKSTTRQARTPKQRPPIWLPPKPAERPRQQAGPATPPAVHRRPATIQLPPRNVPRRGPSVFTT